jgi:uncharacterized protein (TIGR01777 family)
MRIWKFAPARLLFHLSRMKLAVSGASGLVGSALLPELRGADHEVWRLVRGGNAGEPNAITWDPDSGLINRARLAGINGVIHLAGDNIAEGRWTAEKKKRIRDSRTLGTRLLAENAATLSPKPKVLITASATGYYGNREDEPLTETSSSGNDFLADVCQAWEQAAQPAKDAGIRVVHLRFGVILTPQGGALAKMLPPFKAGMGGPAGKGEQFVSWISLDDAVGVILHALEHEELSGAVNVVAPEPIRNKDFSHALGEALGRPSSVPIPAFALKLAFGEMAEATLLASQRVIPQKLLSSGYVFRHTDLASTLKEMLPR